MAVMKKLLKLIEDQRTATGLRIVDNIYDYGACSVRDVNNKQLYYGSRFGCQLFIQQKYDEILSEAT